MRLGKKDLIIIILSFTLLASCVMNIFINYPSDFPVPPSLETLIVGTGSEPRDLDPTDCWDKDSQVVIEQVVETLFTYDTRQYIIDETMPRINWLATGYSWSGGNTILTVDIRSNVQFHDGTTMDANAVAWSFNRFMYLMNHTGALPSDGRVVKVHSLYEFPDGTPIFSSVIALDADTVVFFLTAPYAPILDAMCYISCGILSPASTPANDIIDLGTGDIVGTGPYTYDYYITDTEVRFTKFDDYWGTPLMEDEVMFDALVYSVIDDPSTLNYAMLAGDIHVLFGAMTDLIPTFEANPWITVYEATKPGLVYHYLGFNNRQINLTWRKAMSYAINYTYIIEVRLEGRAHRAYGAISPSYREGFNHWLIDSPQTATGNGSAVFNLTIARQVVINGLRGDARISGLTANSDPNDLAWEAADLLTFNYTYTTNHWFSTDLYLLLEDWFDDIGITVIDGGHDSWPWFPWDSWYVPFDYDELQLYFIGWDPDYLDPLNMLEPLFSNISYSNVFQVNDPWIQGNLSLALETTDEIARNQIYCDIQWRLFAELYVHAPFYYNQIVTVHAADIYNVEYDVMGRWWALPTKRNLTWVPEI